MNRRQLITLVSGAAVWPVVARAQQSRMSLVGFLSSRSEKDSTSVGAAFLKGLGEAGYLDGQNMRMVYRWADGHFDQLPVLAGQLVKQRVSVIAAVGGENAAFAAKAATVTIPIVMVVGTDPTKSGLVDSLARPGGNITGVTLFTSVVEQKRLELLRDLIPTAKTFAVLLNPKGPGYEAKRANTEAVVPLIGQRILILGASTDREIEAAFAAMIQRGVEGLLVGTDPYFSTQRGQIVALAMRHGVPAIYDSRVEVEAGGLASYGTSYTDTYRQAGVYTGRILKGSRPAELPVMLPTKFELVINLTTARAMGLAVPPTLLARADEVIE